MKGMKLITKYNIIFLLLGIILLCVSPLYAGPVVLGDNVLDQVTAGSSEVSGSGGAIIGNSSEATINQIGGVDLSGEAQSGAKGLNLVNSAESTVANGINILDVAEVSSNGETAFSVLQENNIVQEQRRSASMPSYSRPEGDTTLHVDRTGSESHNDQLDRDNTVMDLVSNTRATDNSSTAKVDTTIKGNVGSDLNVDTNVGKGLAIAGQLDATLDGGEMHLGMAVGGPVVGNPDTDTSDSGFGGMTIGNEDSDFTLYGRLILPELVIEINGAGCGVAMGSCESTGTAKENTLDVRDNSTVDTLVTSEIGNSEYTEIKTEVYRSPFELNNAQAEYIVVDDSSLEVDTTFNLLLSGSSQSTVMGMNVVNTTGSAVADGVNVARTETMSGSQLMDLTQSNVISHSR